MLTILIVDDEKLERNGIKFLLKREGESFCILEAGNGKDALGVLSKHHVDILFSDVKMPYMNGLELVGHVRESYPDMEIVIFSGYNDFSYAREALRYGVVDYVLKPVDPAEFKKTLDRVRNNIRLRLEAEEKQTRQADYLTKYFLIEYLYKGNQEEEEQFGKILDDEGSPLSKVERMILVSASNGLFETEEEHFIGSLRDQIQREFYYVNLNSNEALFLFMEKYTDYSGLAGNMYRFFQQQYNSDCYFAVSAPLKSWRDMREQFREMESMLEEQFYQPGQHIFVWGGVKSDEVKEKPVEDAELMERISQDISFQDISHLRSDFQMLEQKYRQQTQYSEMYVKFVFSSILKEIYEQLSSADEKTLSKKVEKLYRCRKISDVLDIVSGAIGEFENLIRDQKVGSREEIASVKSYIHHHYKDNDIGPEVLAAQVYLSPGYLSTIFKEETGMTLNRYIRDVRMARAKDLLETTGMKITQISREVGFSNSSYFCRSFKEYYGVSPESCRRGRTSDEETQANH